MSAIKKSKLLKILILLCIIIPAHAGLVQQNTDTLLKKAQAIYSKQPDLAIAMARNAYRLAKTKNDKVGEVKSLNKIAKFYVQSRTYDTAKLYSGYGLLAAEKYRIDSLQGESWMILGAIDHSISAYNSAIEKYQQAISFYKKDNKSLNLARLYLNIGICHMQLAAYDKSIANCMLAKIFFDKEGDFKDVATTYNTIATCFLDLNNYPKTIEYYKKALIIRLGLKENVPVAQSFNNIGNAFRQYNQPDSAIFYLTKSVSLYQQERDSSLLVLPLQNLGYSWKVKGNFTKAGSYIARSLRIAAKLNMRQELGIGYWHLSQIYLAKKKYEDALKAVNITEKTASDLKTPELLMEAYTVKYNAYLQIGDYKNALLYDNKKNSIKDSIFTVTKDKTINELEIQYQTSIKEKNIATLNLQNKFQGKTLAQQRLSIIALVIGASLLLLLAAIAYNSYRQKKKANIHIQQLMQELHHRVKNNLQILSGLFTMQIENLDDEATKSALRENESRLTSMNLIHNKLYLDHANTKIEMEEYLTKLLQHIKAAFSGAKDNNISLRVDVAPVMIEADKAVAIGLIVNELATNAFKYAFDGQGGEIYLILKESGRSKLLLSLGDTGKGISDVHKENGASFGLKLVNLMARQLGAVMTVQSGGGTQYSFEIGL